MDPTISASRFLLKGSFQLVFIFGNVVDYLYTFQPAEIFLRLKAYLWLCYCLKPVDPRKACPPPSPDPHVNLTAKAYKLF